MKRGESEALSGLVSELRQLCAKLPGAEEYVMVHHPAFRVGKKPFAIAGLGASGERPLLSINLGSEAQAHLLSDPRFEKTPYIGRHGWVTIARGALKKGELAALLTDSWRRVAGSKHRAALKGDGASAAPAEEPKRRAPAPRARSGSQIMIALLRAVNVSGTSTLPMAKLRALLAQHGFTSPTTLLQSGNVVFGVPASLAAKAKSELLEQAIERELGVRTRVIMRSPRELEQALGRNPFAKEAEQEPGKVLLYFLASAPKNAAERALRGAIRGRERVVLDGSTLFAHFPDGVGRSKLTSALMDRMLGVTGTGRNVATCTKLVALAQKLAAQAGA